MSDRPGYVLLENGTRFDGELVGSEGEAAGEVVFNTSMTGYQEAVTDPSYAGQIITFTYPLVGNYGVASTAMESERVQARAVIMREAKNGEDVATAEGGWLDWLDACGVPAIDGVDTRSLVRHIRDRGAMRGGIFSAEVAEAEAARAGSRRTADAGRRLRPPGDPGRADRARWRRPARGRHRHRDQALDHPPVHRARLPDHAAALRRRRRRRCSTATPTWSSSPTAQATRRRSTTSSTPCAGSSAASPWSASASATSSSAERSDSRPSSCAFGHRGANHPVKDLETGKIDITSQNHGFAVRPPGGGETIESDEPVRWETDFGAAELTHLNLYDRTVEGLKLNDVPGCTVQYHPEAGPGPHDARYLFDRFLELAA